jgi:hypothetical protein
MAVPASWPWLVLKSTSSPCFLNIAPDSASTAGSVITPMHILSNLVISVPRVIAGFARTEASIPDLRNEARAGAGQPAIT